MILSLISAVFLELFAPWQVAAVDVNERPDVVVVVVVVGYFGIVPAVCFDPSDFVDLVLVDSVLANAVVE